MLTFDLSNWKDRVAESEKGKTVGRTYESTVKRDQG